MLGDKTAAAESASASPLVFSSTVAIDSAARSGTKLPVVGSAVTSPADPPVHPETNADLAILRGELSIPVSGVVAGELRDTYTEARGSGRLHDAIDIPAPRGTPVLAATSGRVLKLFASKAGGLMVYAADSSERFILMYAHLDGYAPGLSDRSRVARGQIIGYAGTTGNAPPNLPHLHFAIARSADISKWWQGTPVNPYPLLSTK